MKSEIIIIVIVLIFFTTSCLLSENSFNRNKNKEFIIDSAELKPKNKTSVATVKQITSKTNKKDEDKKITNKEFGGKAKKELDECLSQQIASIKIIQQKHIDKLKNALAQFPDSSQLRNKLAITYAHQNQLEKAEKHFQQLLVKDSTDFFALNNIGNLYFMKGDLNSVQTYYLKALDYAKGEDRDAIYLNLGLLYAAAGLDSEAVDMFAQVMRNPTDYQKIGDLLGVTIQEEDLVKGAELEPKKEVCETTVRQLIIKAKKKTTKKSDKKVNKKKNLVTKGDQPREEIENVFYWAY